MARRDPERRARSPRADAVRVLTAEPAADAAGPGDGQPRLFVAVPLPLDAVERVEGIVAAVRTDLDREARARRSEVRWVRLEGVHVTMRFLGATDPARVEAVGDAVARAARGHGPFRTVVAGAGAFPSPSRPRTLWLGLTNGREALAALAQSVDAELVGLGWPPSDREFRPHLTLARADGRREGPRAAQLLHQRSANVAIPFEVDRVVLFESVTGGGPARYVPVRSVPLSG